MIERVPKQEHIPTEDEIKSLFEKLTEGRAYTERRKLSDEAGEGVYLWEITLTEPDSEGNVTEYSYAKKGQYPESKARETAIHKTVFDADGMPFAGGSVMKFVDGEWKETL